MEINAEIKKPGLVFAEAAIKAKWDYNDFLLAEIFEILADCKPFEIQAIVKNLLRSCKFTPKVSEIVKAKNEIRPEHTGIAQYGKKEAWDIREEKIYKMVDDYCREFELTADYTQAENEDWVSDLERFVRSTATTMAWMIEGYIAPGKDYAKWGWDSGAVNTCYRDEYHLMLKRLHPIIAREGIDVMKAMPGGQIPKWRERATRPKEIKQQSDYNKHLNSILENAKAKRKYAA